MEKIPVVLLFIISLAACLAGTAIKNHYSKSLSDTLAGYHLYNALTAIVCSLTLLALSLIVDLSAFICLGRVTSHLEDASDVTSARERNTSSSATRSALLRILSQFSAMKLRRLVNMYQSGTTLQEQMDHTRQKGVSKQS